MSLTSAEIDKFLTVLKQSGLIEESIVERLWEEFQKKSSELTPEAFAEVLVETGRITNWHATKLLKGKHKGFFLGKYKLLRLLGRGGMSSVYLAEHLTMKRQCAVKVLPYKLVSDSSYLPRFYREAQAVAALDHPNIVRAYDVDHQTDGTMEIHFLVMEYVTGYNFFELVKGQGRLSARTAAEYIRQGALGLQHAHGAGMVHRDVKPGNFIVDDNGTVKVMDLGLAMVSVGSDYEHSVTLANEEKVLGTADYLAPEQAVDSHVIDSRADIYALGCTFFFLLTGHPPYDEGTLAQRLLSHQTKTPPEISEFREDVPEAVQDILKRMMAKNPDERIQTAGEVAAELAEWLNAGTNCDSGGAPPPFLLQNPNPKTGESPQGAISDFLLHLESQSPSKSGKASDPGKKKPGGHSPQNSDSGISVFNSGTSTIVSSRQGSQVQKRKKKRRSAQRIRNSCLGILAGVLGIALLYSRFLPDPLENGSNWVVTPPVPPAPEQPPVSGPIVSVGPTGDFPNLSAAIQYCSNRSDVTGAPIQEIRIAAGQTLNDLLHLENSGFNSIPTPLRIVGEGPDFPTMKSPSGLPFVLNSIEGLSISNLIIDCTDQPVGLELSGYLSGTTIQNVTFKNIFGTGILARGVSGLAGRPFSLQGCRFEGGSDTAIGVRCVGTETSNTRELSIKGCRFIGPLGKGIVFSSPEGSTWDVTITQCLFDQTRTGLAFAGTDHDVSRVKIANNTFHDFTRGIHFESGPVLASTAVTFLQNLFVNGNGYEVSTEREQVALSELARGTLPPQRNWTTGPIQESSTWLNIFENQGRTAASGIEFISTDPHSADFLKPKGASMKSTVHAPIDGRNFIGAVSP